MVLKRLALLRETRILDFLMATEAAPLLATLVFLAANGHGAHGLELGWPDSPLLRWVLVALSGQA